MVAVVVITFEHTCGHRVWEFWRLTLHCEPELTRRMIPPLPHWVDIDGFGPGSSLVEHLQIYIKGVCLLLSPRLTFEREEEEERGGGRRSVGARQQKSLRRKIERAVS